MRYAKSFFMACMMLASLLRADGIPLSLPLEMMGFSNGTTRIDFNHFHVSEKFIGQRMEIDIIVAAWREGEKLFVQTRWWLYIIEPNKTTRLRHRYVIRKINLESGAENIFEVQGVNVPWRSF